MELAEQRSCSETSTLIEVALVSSRTLVKWAGQRTATPLGQGGACQPDPALSSRPLGVPRLRAVRARYVRLPIPRSLLERARSRRTGSSGSAGRHRRLGPPPCEGKPDLELFVRSPGAWAIFHDDANFATGRFCPRVVAVASAGTFEQEAVPTGSEARVGYHQRRSDEARPLNRRAQPG